MKTLCFICGAPRTGTSFLCNILRGHPSIGVFPDESKIWLYWKKYGPSFFERDYLYTPEVQMLCNDNLQKQMSAYQEEVYQAHEEYKLEKFNWRKARNWIAEHATCSSSSAAPSTLFEAYMMLIMACGLDKYDTVVIKSPLVNEVGAMDLNFPDTVFIHMQRDYRTRYISAKFRRINDSKGITVVCGEYGFDFPTLHASTTMFSNTLCELNQNILGKNCYMSLSYEKLVEDFYSSDSLSLSYLADFLNVEYKESFKDVNQPALSSIKFSGFEKRLLDYNDYTSTSEKAINDLFNVPDVTGSGLSLQDLLVMFYGEDPGEYVETRKSMQAIVGKPEVIKMRFFHRFMEAFRKGIDIQG